MSSLLVPINCEEYQYGTLIGHLTLKADDWHYRYALCIRCYLCGGQVVIDVVPWGSCSCGDSCNNIKMGETVMRQRWGERWRYGKAGGSFLLKVKLSKNMYYQIEKMKKILFDPQAISRWVV